eukprot:853043-Pyramimonas_sp.AAC.1
MLLIDLFKKAVDIYISYAKTCRYSNLATPVPILAVVIRGESRPISPIRMYLAWRRCVCRATRGQATRIWKEARM